MDHQDAVDRTNSMPMSVAERVINVHTTKEYGWVLENVFSEEKCGKRNKTLFWKSDKPGSCHFFIEFANKESVSIAQREAAGPGVTVHCLSRNMNMAYIFDCLSRGLDPPKKRTNVDTEGSQVGDPPPDSGKYSTVSSNGPTPAKRPRMLENEPARRASPPPSYREASSYKPYQRPTNFSQNPREPLQRTHPYPSKPKQAWNIPPDNRDNTRRYQTNYNNNNYQKLRFRNNDHRSSNRSSNGSVSPPRRPKDDSLYYGERDDDRGRSRDRDFSPSRSSYRRASDTSKRPPDSSIKRPSDATIRPPLDSYGPTGPRNPIPPQSSVVETINLSDLDSLNDDNIAAVIDSLKASYSGPETWMSVAAHYRRRRRHKNALAVVDSMLEVMRERGMDKADLRPALLLMAQCHYSIGNEEIKESESLEAANRHFVLLLDWLRETYGPFTPAVDAIAQSAHRDPLSGLKESTSLLSQNPFDFSNQRISIPGFETLQLPSANPSLFDTHSSAAARLEAVSEENTRLRESRSATSAELATCRTALHEAENTSRSTEVKLQRALEDHRLAAASAIRESDARRRAEERLAQERKAWERRMDELRDEGARAAMRELTAILTLSARAPTSMLEATRVFCEARGRVERDAPNTA